MNLALFLRVLRRFRYLVVSGVLLATLLAAFSAARISVDGGTPRLEPRGEEEWHSAATLFVTQKGFPWGRSVLDDVVPLGPDGKAGYAPRYSDGSRFQGLAVLYAQLAQSDAVHSLVLRGGAIEGGYTAEPVRSQDGSVTLPLFRIIGIGASPENAKMLAARATDAFLVHFRRTQEKNEIPPEARVHVEVVDRPTEAVLVQGRRMTRPIFLFVLVLSATIMLAFVLENLRPRAPLADATALAPTTGATALSEAARKTA